MRSTEETRIRNPFQDPLVTELIEDPHLYSKMFSERILIGETLSLFQPANVVLVGPQGTGKSMLLNLIRYGVLSEWITNRGAPPSPIKHMAPFVGISINLVRASFHAFGRRSVVAALKPGESDYALDVASAADFLSHYLFREFLKGLEFLLSQKGSGLRGWLGVNDKGFTSDDLAEGMSSWDSWFGYYAGSRSISDLLNKCENRLSKWRSFLNTNIDQIPEDIWATKTTPGDALHLMGNLLCARRGSSERLPLFVVIDQYEVLPELNPTHGTSLQRLVNTLIKARDPVVFYKIGARTYDWGNELRIWGADSRIEVQRDYVLIDLAEVLMRNEDSKGWLFPEFATDVAYKRLTEVGQYSRVRKDSVKRILGRWTPNNEASLYFRTKPRKSAVIGKLPDPLRRKIESVCGRDTSALDLRLAGAWALQRRQKGMRDAEIIKELEEAPWKKKVWWRKERIEIALLQVASLANQKRRYFGWETVMYLSGANISVFLLICAEIWDVSTKMGLDPLKDCPLLPTVQTDGVFVASEKWRNRDKNERVGGSQRYQVLSILGALIHKVLIRDLAISNPGHSGFSLRETELTGDKKKEEVARFIHNAVSWAILEERAHTSKLKGDVTRRKWYLHPLLCPVFAIPFKRVKEPLYVRIDDVHAWIFGTGVPRFGRKDLALLSGKDTFPQQLEFPLGGPR